MNHRISRHLPDICFSVKISQVSVQKNFITKLAIGYGSYDRKHGQTSCIRYSNNGFGTRYRYSPVSPLCFDNRQQDFDGQ
jgi:hypothetical protein